MLKIWGEFDPNGGKSPLATWKAPPMVPARIMKIWDRFQTNDVPKRPT
jgi:hypothetical protein